MDVFDLVAKISLDTSEYEGGLSQASASSESFGSKLGKGLGTAAKVGGAMVGVLATGVTVVSAKMADGIKQTAAYGDEIDKSSQKLGVSASFYQEWDAVLQHSGTSMSAMTGTFKTLSKAVQDGSAEQQEAFAKIGLSMEELSSVSTEEAFQKVIAGLQGMEEGTERTALASQLLGRGAMEMGALLNTSSEDTQKMIDTVHELGGVMSDEAVKASARFQDSLQDMQTAFSGAKNAMSAEFLPAVADVMDGIASIFGGDSAGGMELIKQGLEGFQQSIEETMPKVMETAQRLLPVIIEAITAGLPVLLDAASQILFTLAQGLLDNAPQIFQSAGDIIIQLVDGLVAMLPQMVDTAAQIIAQLAFGIAAALPELIPTIIDVILQIVDTLISNADMLIDAAIALITGLAEGLIASLPTLIEKAPTIIDNLVMAIANNAPKILEAGIQLIIALGVGLIQAIPQIVAKIPQIVMSLVNAIKTYVKNFADVGKNLVDGLWNGISSGWTWLTEKVKDLANKLVDGVKGVLGIHSPSKVFAGIGQFMAEGLDEGWSDEFSNVQKNINGSLEFNAEPLQMKPAETQGDAKIISWLEQNLPTLLNQSIVLDTGVLVGQTVGAMDDALGKRMQMNARYA